MNTQYLCIALVGSALTGSTQAKTLNGSATWIKAPVERVVVFADRAQVFRRASAACTRKRAVVDIGGLVVGLDARSLRATTVKGAKVLGVNHRIEALEHDSDQRVRALRSEVAALDRALDDIERQETDVMVRQRASDSYAGYFKTLWQENLRGPDLRVTEWTMALDSLEGEALGSALQMVALAKQARELQKKRDLAQRRLSRLSARVLPETLVAQISVDCGKLSRIEIWLSYMVGGARWRPEYDLRFSAKNKGGAGQIELTVGAIIEQSTGEDWEQAHISLSTAKPRMGDKAPLPAALYVDGHEVGSQRVLVQASEKRDKLASGGKQNTRGPQNAGLSDHGQSVLLRIPAKATVRADGRPYWFPIDQITSPAKALLVAVPKLSPYVYQAVQLNNPASYPLLAGVVHTYRGGSYVGDTRIPYRGAGEDMEVSLGLDQRFRVERIDLAKRDRGPGFLSSTRSLERAYLIKIKSQARSTATIELRERIPVPKDKAIRVTLNRTKTSPGFALDAHRGFVTWKVKMKSGTESKTVLHYSIKLPEKWQM